ATGSFELNQASVELPRLVQDVVERLRETTDRARCELVVRVDERIVGHWDRLRIDQVLVNLLGNAIKYAAGTLIELTATLDGADAVIQVTDHGPGIPPGDLAR